MPNKFHTLFSQVMGDKSHSVGSRGCKTVKVVVKVERMKQLRANSG